MKKTRTLGLIALTLVTAMPSMAKWKIHIDKKVSQITGARNVRAEVTAKRGKAVLLLGCTDAKPILRLAENFSIDNALNDALTKSRLERAIDKSQRFGFEMIERDALYRSRVKVRLGAAKEYLDAEVQAGYNDGVYFLILDDRLSELLPGMKTDSVIFAQLPYKDGDKVREFPLAGFDSALAKMAENGCRL